MLIFILVNSQRNHIAKVHICINAVTFGRRRFDSCEYSCILKFDWRDCGKENNARKIANNFHISIKH